ncbi:hypothetical protein GXM_07210 [Nostoc sphaeroides CCNUC1]|uniref:Uncharacterized protein n=1 Tax=Nostoc sphaeroides CCNUC1 TaxID=2653204 RepID=A0A5P8WBZ8_9NOSO|nr:hypothetical protein GXM_07210 [Nostoc sphaeroides CCNUC1]
MWRLAVGRTDQRCPNLAAISALPAFLTSGAIAMSKPLSGLDFEHFRHCTNHNSM